MTKANKLILQVFERWILWWIFGVVDDSDWRVRNNQDFDELINGGDIVRFIKSLRLTGLGPVTRMCNKRIPSRILDGEMNKKMRKTKTDNGFKMLRAF